MIPAAIVLSGSIVIKVLAKPPPAEKPAAAYGALPAM